MRSMLVVGIAFALSACSMFTRSVERPTATVRTVEVSSAGFTGLTGELRLDISNPNAFGVPLSGIDWQLSIGGARAVTGRVSLSQTIPAKGTAPVTTSLTIDARDAIAVAAELAGGARDYQIALELQFSTPVGPLDVGVQHTGQLGDAASLIGFAN